MIRSIVHLMRPHHWSKNALSFAGLVFGGHLAEIYSLLLAATVFLVFCAASSAGYVLNDIVDRKRDQNHPRKRNRPLASATIGVGQAVFIAAFLCLAAVTVSAFLGWAVLTCILLYLANTILYSTFFKNMAVFDLLAIALGFVLRLSAGIYVLGDLPTAWIVACTFFLALFLACAKRRAELADLTTDHAERRPVLAGYTLAYLDSLLSSAATMSVICYALFTVLSSTNPTLIVTLPIVYYVIMHYKRRVMIESAGEEPEYLLLKDWRIPVLLVIWLLVYGAIAYLDLRLFV